MLETTVKLIVGLGNPGPAYRHHRHNLGFRVVEELARRRSLAFAPGGGSYDLAGSAGPGGGLVLLKPLTYMNLSGQALDDWSRDAGVALTGRPTAAAEEEELGTPPVRPMVVCDDLSLPLGSLRLRPRGSSGGQNGLASVIEHLGGQEFPRCRLGIAPVDGPLDPALWHDHVLAAFAADEREAADAMVAHAATALECWLERGLEEAISRFNRRLRPDPDAPE